MPHDAAPPHLSFWFFPAFAAMWVGMNLFLSHLSGWAYLARNCRTFESASGETFTFASASLGIVDYRSCLDVVVNDRGLRMAPFFIFRIGAPPLFIPWSEIESMKETKFLFLRSASFRVRGAWPHVRVRGAAGKAILAMHARVNRT